VQRYITRVAERVVGRGVEQRLDLLCLEDADIGVGFREAPAWLPG
jgi:hypothetical protein